MTELATETEAATEAESETETATEAEETTEAVEETTVEETTEPATITWIEDKPGPSKQGHNTFPEVPDSLWDALGLKDGVPSSMSCFLLRTEGKTILLDAGLGAPFSQLIPKLNEEGENLNE